MSLVKSTFGTSPSIIQAFQTALSPLALVMHSGFIAFSSSTEPLHFLVISTFSSGPRLATTRLLRKLKPPTPHKRANGTLHPPEKKVCGTYVILSFFGA